MTRPYIIHIHPAPIPDTPAGDALRDALAGIFRRVSEWNNSVGGSDPAVTETVRLPGPHFVAAGSELPTQNRAGVCLRSRPCLLLRECE